MSLFSEHIFFTVYPVEEEEGEERNDQRVLQFAYIRKKEGLLNYNMIMNGLRKQ